MHVSGYTCLSCGETQPASFQGFVCAKCGGNLDVRYDYKEAASTGFPNERQDLFRYSALLPVTDLRLATPLRVGMTPLYRADRLGATIGLKNLWLKDDGLNPSASFKDRASAVALVVARERGAKVIAGATTGNAGSSMACLAASVAMPCVIFVPEKAPPAKIAQLLVFGAKVLAVRGNYDQAFDLCTEVCKQRGWFNRNTGSNPFTREGKKTCSFEVWEQIGRKVPHWIVVCTGDGNIISGIWKGFRDLKAMGLITTMPRLLCAQAETSAAISQTVRRIRKGHAPCTWGDVEVEHVKATTLADSISVDIPRDGLAAVRAVIESDGDVVTVTDQEILQAIPDIARGAGVFAEPAAATGWACTRKAASAGLIRPDDRVVCLISGNGLKDVGSARKSVGEPVVIDANMGAAEKALSDLTLTSPT